MKALVLFSSILVVSIYATAQTDSVYYHHGSFQSQYGSSGATPTADFYRYVTRFTPPSYPAQLIGMKVWFRNAGNPSSFKWVIYKDSSGNALGPQSSPDYMSPTAISNPASGGVTDSSYSYFTDFTTENIMISGGDVYAGVTQHPQINGFLGISIDTSNAFTQDRPWVFNGGWTRMINWAFIDGEWGITAYFSSIPNSVGKFEGPVFSIPVFPNPN